MLSAIRSYSSAPNPTPQDNKPANEVAVKKDPIVTAAKAKKLLARAKEEVLHYYHGFKLLALETKISSKLLFRLMKGYDLSRREQRQVTFHLHWSLNL